MSYNIHGNQREILIHAAFELVLSECVLRNIMHNTGDVAEGPQPPDPVLSGLQSDCSAVLDHAERPPACLKFASGEFLSEGYGHDGPDVYLGDDQTEAEVVTSQCVDAATRCSGVCPKT